jgi:hypothetical protein
VTLGTLLLGVLVLSAVVVALAFRTGDEARRTAQGRAGPRPAPSIGEAVRQARLKPGGGRALVLFLADDAASADARRALVDDAAVVEALSAPDLTHAIVQAGGDERQVAAMLFEKYARRPLPEDRPAALLLDGHSKTIAASADPGSLPSWLPRWLSVSGSTAPEGPGPSS